MSRFKSFFILFSCVLVSLSCSSQEKPKLIIGIVVDQMRPDYLDLYFSGKGNDEIKGGFVKMQKEGLVFKQTFLGYMPSFTGPGHASVFTGMTPSGHGIVANDWYDREKKRMIYCVDDEEYKGVGGVEEENRKSPHLLMAPTLGDRMKDDNSSAKVIGIALKDRASVLPAGKKGDMAYWFDGDAGEWVSSSYYCKELPKWVKQFNKNKLIDKYLETPWNLLYPLDMYVSIISDDNPYETLFKGEERPTFPHDIPHLKDKNGGANIIKAIPFGNNLTAEFAKTAIINERLGQDDVTDLLTLSFSSTDYVGHRYGPGSLELEDTYYRLNYVIDDLIDFLDEQVGKGQYLMFLTADHGVQPNSQYAKDSLGVDAGFFESDKAAEVLEAELEAEFGVKDLIANVYNYQVYFDRDKIDSAGLTLKQLQDYARDFYKKQEGIAYAFANVDELIGSMYDVSKIIKAGIFNGRSGDVFFVLKKGWLEASKYGVTGASHGSPYDEDTQVPLLFYGWHIKPGAVDTKVNVTEAVPAIWEMIGIKQSLIYLDNNQVLKKLVN